jgi:drug/metabolite transporter (DMT)-like permease
MKTTPTEPKPATGSVLFGLALALLCQGAYVYAVRMVSDDTQRMFGYVFFALVQFFYLVPLALFFRHRGKGSTAGGFILAAALGLVAAGGCYGYYMMYGRLPAFLGSF